MLTLKNLSCERDQRLLFSGLNFVASAGEIVQVTGANGAGKSTLLRILCGLFDNYEGQVSWDLDDYPLYLGHKPGVKDLLTVEENLTWLGQLQQQTFSRQAVTDVLARVGLKGYQSVLCGNLSEGQRKRVNLARLFLVKSKVWLLDEPFSAIDAEGILDIEAQMKRQAEAGGLILFTSHQRLQTQTNLRTLALGKH